jgi:drug/metabolite transporter (DMT)-like permease
MRSILKALRLITAILLLGFGLVIIVGFAWTMIQGGDETPLWHHLLAVGFMGVLPVAAAMFLFFLKSSPKSQDGIPRE